MVIARVTSPTNTVGQPVSKSSQLFQIQNRESRERLRPVIISSFSQCSNFATRTRAGSVVTRAGGARENGTATYTRSHAPQHAALVEIVRSVTLQRLKTQNAQPSVDDHALSLCLEGRRNKLKLSSLVGQTCQLPLSDMTCLVPVTALA